MPKVKCPFCGVNTFAGRKCHKCSKSVPTVGLEEETEEFTEEEVIEPIIDYPEESEEEITFDEEE